MATISDIIEGLSLLKAANIIVNGDGNDPSAVDAQHDVIYCQGPQPEKIDPVMVKRLNELGWHWDRDYDCSWRCYT